jgi:hypothetical protein
MSPKSKKSSFTSVNKFSVRNVARVRFAVDHGDGGSSSEFESRARSPPPKPVPPDIVTA